ncbi:MAG: penicillin acylase family protein, partial [bacterium]
MTLPLRKIFAILIFVFVIGLAVTLLGYRLVVKSLPDYDATIDIAKLEAETTVCWDEYKVPHIYAQNENDMFRVAGYLAAQERLWQMDILRRAAQGRLSEIFGEQALESDLFARTWGFFRTAEKLTDSLPQKTLDALKLYISGINSFIDSHQDKLPIEFSILAYKPEKWKITDSIAFSRFMAFQLSFTWHLEPVLYLIAEKVGREKALQLFPEFPKNAPVIVSERSHTNTEILAEFLDRSRSAKKIFGSNGTVAVSNSWVISSQKSATGKPILANDPHLNLNFPSIWYEMHLVGGNFDVMGVTFPGVPGVVIGHNRAAAWGLTNGMIDDADFYFEQINPADPEQYWDGKSWQLFKIFREEIKVKDAD